MTTTVVHCRKSEYDVYVGRPTQWGNPYLIGLHGTREQVIQMYKEYILTQEDLIKDLKLLKDKRLGCWCKPQACHGDVLAELADLLGEYS